MYLSDLDLAAIIASHPNKAVATLGDGSFLDGIFTAPAKNVMLLDGSVNSLDPRFTTRRSDAAAKALDIDSYLTINGQAYIIIDTEERNDGMVGFPLSKTEIPEPAP